MRSVWTIFAIAALIVPSGIAAAQTWTTEYTADASPDAAKPAWQTSIVEGGTLSVREGLCTIASAPGAGGGVHMAIGHNTPDAYMKGTRWGDADAWDASKPTTLEFRMRVAKASLQHPLAVNVQLSDGVNFYYVHLSEKGVCSLDGTVRHAVDATQFHTYRVTLKNRMPNLYVDGKEAPVTCFHTGLTPRNALVIGDLSTAASGTTEWDAIRWTNAEATPWKNMPLPKAGPVDKGTVWLDPRFTEIDLGVDYPCWGGHSPVRLPDGRIMITYWGPEWLIGRPHGIHRVFSRISADEGKTWGPEREVAHHPECKAVGPSALVCKDGAVRVFYMGFYNSVWKDGNPDFDQTRSDLWTIESHDSGKTWTNKQMIFRGYTGATNGAIEMSSGHIVVPFSYDKADPGRLVSACVVSADNGKTWTVGDCVDLGGQGDHGGAMEPAVVELRDGRLWMIVRTTKGRFWQAYSTDHGLTWTDVGPTKFQSPSAPCHIIRLASGRLVMAWNNTMASTKGRDAMSLAFSEDDGKTWTDPLVFAKAKEVSYPGLFEPTPGVLWIAAHNVNAGWKNIAQIFVKAHEDDLLKKAGAE
jgi:BNR repeat protein